MLRKAFVASCLLAIFSGFWYFYKYQELKRKPASKAQTTRRLLVEL